MSRQSTKKMVRPHGEVEVRRVADTGARLGGQVTKHSLLEIIQLISLSRKSGLFTATDNSELFKIYFDAGRIIHAQGGMNDSLQGMASVLAIFRITNGVFEFAPDARPDKATVNFDTENILMQVSMAMDEKSHEPDDPKAAEQPKIALVKKESLEELAKALFGEDDPLFSESPDDERIELADHLFDDDGEIDANSDDPLARSLSADKSLVAYSLYSDSGTLQKHSKRENAAVWDGSALLAIAEGEACASIIESACELSALFVSGNLELAVVHYGDERRKALFELDGRLVVGELEAKAKPLVTVRKLKAIRKLK